MRKILLFIVLACFVSCKNETKKPAKSLSEKPFQTFYKTAYKTDNFTFFIDVKNGEMSKIHLFTKGLEFNYDETLEIEGQVLDSKMLDINNDGFKEFYLKVKPTDDSGNVHLMAFASNNGKGISEIYIKESDHLRDVNTDVVTFKDDTITRSFKTNGKVETYTYELIQGEATWILQPVHKTKVSFMEFTVNDNLAAKIGAFLKEDYLKKDYTILTDFDKKYQLAEIDLNNDGKKEIFINLMGRYFCGSGGCTMLLLDSDLKIITKFTVMNPPLFIQKETKNGWKTFLIKSEEKFRKMVYKNGKYPSNPSVVKSVDYYPNGHDWVLFDAQFSPSKTYTF